MNSGNFDSNINIEEMNIPKPKKYDIKFLIKVLLVKEFETQFKRNRSKYRIWNKDRSFSMTGEETAYIEIITNEVLKA